MDRDSMQDLPVEVRRLEPAPWRWSVIGAVVVIALVAGVAWILSRQQGSQVQAAFEAGNTAAATGDTNGAIAGYDLAITLQPNFPEAYYRRGLQYTYKDQLDIAIADFTRAIAQKPDYAEAYYQRALTYQKNNRKPEAVADLRQVLSLTQDPELQRQATNALAGLGEK